MPPSSLISRTIGKTSRRESPPYEYTRLWLRVVRALHPHLEGLKRVAPNVLNSLLHVYPRAPATSPTINFPIPVALTSRKNNASIPHHRNSSLAPNWPLQLADFPAVYTHTHSHHGDGSNGKCKYPRRCTLDSNRPVFMKKKRVRERAAALFAHANREGIAQNEAQNKGTSRKQKPGGDIRALLSFFLSFSFTLSLCIRRWLATVLSLRERERAHPYNAFFVFFL